jgi:hypothetical protein
VEIVDPFDRFSLDDARAVEDLTRRHQHAVDVERVLGRNPQIARRLAVGERPGLDPDRQHRAIAGDEAALIAAPPDPSNRLRFARQRHHLVADR